MFIGTRVWDGATDQIWSTNDIGYWRDHVTSYRPLIRSLDECGTGRSRYQDYIPVMTLQLHRWDDDSRD